MLYGMFKHYTAFNFGTVPLWKKYEAHLRWVPDEEEMSFIEAIVYKILLAPVPAMLKDLGYYSRMHIVPIIPQI